MKKLAFILFLLHINSINVHAQQYYSRMFDLFHSWEDAGNIISYDTNNKSLVYIGNFINPFDKPDSFCCGLVYTALLDSIGKITVRSILGKDSMAYYLHVALYNVEKNSMLLKTENTRVRWGKIYYQLIRLNTNGDTIASVPFETGDFDAAFMKYLDNKYYVFGYDGRIQGSPLSVLCMDTLGKQLWYKVYPEKRSLIFGVAFDNSNNFILSGGIYQVPNNNDSI